MQVFWLGQAGLLIQADGLKIMIDPYLSDSVGKFDPQKKRSVAVKESLFDIKPDVIIFTHDHLDHFDPETAEKFIGNDSNILILAPQLVWDKVKQMGSNNNYVLFDRHTEWTEKGVRFSAVKAVHSDRFAIGVIVECEHRKLYITGDTLYSEEIFFDIPNDIYACFLPVNGHGNNMNMADAARFAKRIGAQKTVPVHIGLFDDLSADDFDCENKVIPQIYKEIKL